MTYRIVRDDGQDFEILDEVAQAVGRFTSNSLMEGDLLSQEMNENANDYGSELGVPWGLLLANLAGIAKFMAPLDITVLRTAEIVSETTGVKI